MIKIIKFYERKIILKKQTYFIKWKESGKYQKYFDNLKSEIEKKFKNKYDSKIEEYEKNIKKYNQELKELKKKIGACELNFENYQKCVGDFEIKEKDLINQNKNLLEDKKNILEVLKQVNKELKINISKIENYLKELEKSFEIENEIYGEKEIFLNNYIIEMNSLLDFYEMKSSNLFIINIKNLFFYFFES